MSNLQQQRNDVTHIDGNLHQNKDVRIGIVVGRFNGFVVESLVDGAIDALLRHGVLGSNITVIRVPGAFELPLENLLTYALLHTRSIRNQLLVEKHTLLVPSRKYSKTRNARRSQLACKNSMKIEEEEEAAERPEKAKCHVFYAISPKIMPNTMIV